MADLVIPIIKIIIIPVIKIVLVLFALVLTLTAVLVWVERKQSAVFQQRIGPNRANIGRFRALGLIHIVADDIKMMAKEDFIPDRAHRTLHTLAPILAFTPVLVVFAVIPLGDVLKIGGSEIPLAIANLNAGLLFMFAIASFGVYGVALAGWSSNNKWSLLGGVRPTSLMISYAVTLGLSLIGILMVFGTVNLNEIVRGQGELLGGWIPKWGVLVQPLGFLLFFAAAFVEAKRNPFDLPEGESELVAGYVTEYSSMKFGMFFLGEFAEIIVVSAMLTTLFFGGWQVPYMTPEGFAFPPLSFEIALPNIILVGLQVGAFTVKLIFFCWLITMIRWTLPRFRYDQVMRLGWKMLLPLSLINIVITGCVILALNRG